MLTAVTFSSAGTYYLGVSNANNTGLQRGDGRRRCQRWAVRHRQLQLTVTLLPFDLDDSIPKRSIGGRSPPLEPLVTMRSTPISMLTFTVSLSVTIRSYDFDIDTPLNGVGGLGAYIRLINSLGGQLAFTMMA